MNQSHAIKTRMSQKSFKNRNNFSNVNNFEHQTPSVKNQQQSNDGRFLKRGKHDFYDQQIYTQSEETIYCEAEEETDFDQDNFGTEGTLQHSFRRSKVPVIEMIQMQDTKRSSLNPKSHTTSTRSVLQQIHTEDYSSNQTSPENSQRYRNLELELGRKSQMQNQNQIEMSFGYYNNSQSS
jgi:hypothetical protein